MKKLILLTLVLISACTPSPIDEPLSDACECALYVTVIDIKTSNVLIPEYLYRTYTDDECTSDGTIVISQTHNQSTNKLLFPDIYDDADGVASIRFKPICN